MEIFLPIIVEQKVIKPFLKSQSLINQGNILTRSVLKLIKLIPLLSQSLINQGNILTELNRRQVLISANDRSQSLINQGNILTNV